MMIKGVLFDFDGTLTLPGALDFPAIKRVLGCPLEHPILEFIALQPPDQRSELLKMLEEQEDLAAGTSLPNRGAERCLQVLKDKQMPMGIVTRNSLRSVRRALEQFERIAIEDFVAVVTREVSLPKPHPQGVLEGARRMGLVPAEVAVVGDFRFDVMSGKRAGAVAILLTNGGVSVMAPDDPEPDYIIGHLDELPALLDRHPCEACIRSSKLKAQS
ncbi:MAG: hydrogenase expression/formation protein HypE [Thermodesulfobacteriota bacterium]|nr:hydrogenase expression/formation protein HypE [Thermodesulfobacteriota bacterium]